MYGWTMSYKWGHPVASLPSDGGDYTSFSLNDVNSANQSLIFPIGCSWLRIRPLSTSTSSTQPCLIHT
eukprot:4862016-Pleurochrysis_carterae.AAC.1